MTPEEKNHVDPDIATISQRGYQLLREEQFEEANDHFRQVLEVEPDNSYALVGLGDSARKTNRYETAIEYYQRCLDHDHDNSYALFGLADSYRAQRKYHQALKVWERYLKHDDTNVTVLTRVADGYRKVRDKARSRELYERVLELESDNPYALIGLGHLHYDFREYEEALSSWQRMYEIAGEGVDIRVLTSIGNCFRKLKRFRDGIPYFEQALEREPGNFYALFGLADCHRGMNEPEQSLRYWNQILDRDPTNKVILTRAGDAYRAMGEYERAEQCYQRALNIEYDTYAILGLALISRIRGDIDDAVESLQSLKEREPTNHRIYVELANTYAHANRNDEAIEVLEEYLSSGQTNGYVVELLDRFRAG
jgi:tetratricopeptide (TPR) repeat protein